jgi:hypothetical protein
MLKNTQAVDESDLFLASQSSSLEDFLKTDIACGKRIHCSFPMNSRDDYLLSLLSKKSVVWIKFANTDKLYPPDFQPELVSLSSLAELTTFTCLPTPVSKHIFCQFLSSELTYQQKRALNKQEVQSVSFKDGHTLYAPFC